MANSYHQKQFLPFGHGSAPTIRSLSNSRAQSHVLVTTDRAVAVLQYDAARDEYALHELALERFASADIDVIASGVIELPGYEAIAIAYADDEKLFLHVAAATELLRDAATVKSSSSGGSAANASALASSIRFELVAAPIAIASVSAVATTSSSEQFYGVLLFRMDALVAFGYVLDTTAAAQDAPPQCARLSSEQFSRFFPELAAFAHPVVAFDQLLQRKTSAIALGCADGVVSVFQGSVERGCSCGPYMTQRFQIDGPVTSICLFETHPDTTQCNVLVTCAIGHAVVITDVFGPSPQTHELAGADQFDSVFAGVALDLDLDGHVELVLGTDDQHVLAYKQMAQAPLRVDGREHATASVGDSARHGLAPASSNSASASAPSSQDATEDSAQVLSATAVRWSQLPATQWRVQVFGAIYSLARVDVNRDGVDELLVVSSTGVFVFEADRAAVVRKLEALLLPSSSSSSSALPSSGCPRRPSLSSSPGAAAAAVVPRAPARAAPRARALSILSSLFPSAARSSSLLYDDTAAVEGAPGLFQLPNLHKPQDFYRLTAEVKAKCDALKHTISNAICSVIDAAELCRNVHPDEAYRNAASACFTDLSDFIQNLNADVELYDALASVTDNRELMTHGLSEEQRRMATLLRNEFERDGIHLAPAGRQHVIALQNRITQLSMAFQRTLFTARAFIEVPEKLLRPLPHGIRSLCERKLTDPSVVRVPTDLHVMNTVLKWIGDPSVRKDMYMTANACAVANLETLDELKNKRHELAQLLGFPTYAHFATSDRMVGSPEAVEQFIQDISHQLMPNARKEQQLLLAAKQRLEGRGASQVFMWDVPYYMGMLKAQTHRIDSRVISAYFPLERCLDGLHILCAELFGMELKAVPMAKHESWDPDVRKLELLKDGDVLGTIYFDLYPRRHKYTNAAHFTIRCGKQVAPGTYQKPIVALVCNFSKPAPSSPSLLTHSEVETLFHEFGHAMHSLLSRTEFQHLAGTRAQLDFVETPSHLFEYFAWDYRFVRTFARHYETNEPIPYAMMEGLRQSKNMFAAMDTQTQCLYSLLDLKIFGEQPLPYDPPTTTGALKHLQNMSTLIPHVDQTFWHARFGHLVGYGAGYYSYLYARVFASDIWHACFRDDPMNAAAGEKLFQELLVHGGAKDPNDMLLAMIGKAPTPQSYLRELGV